MQYVGGKQKSGGQHIARILNESCPQGGTIYEPMCGGLSVTYRLKHPVIASDACVHLMALHRAVQEGWEPPEVSKDLWLECKERAERSYADPLVGFMGYGCSYTGSWFGSYVDKYKYTKRVVPAAQAAIDSLRKKISKCHDVTFVRGRDYGVTPDKGITYCDIPYEGTKGYPSVGPFNHEAFFEWALQRQTPILISEQSEPRQGFVEVCSWGRQNRLATSSKTRRLERLLTPSKWASFWRVTL